MGSWSKGLLMLTTLPPYCCINARKSKGKRVRSVWEAVHSIGKGLSLTFFMLGTSHLVKYECSEARPRVPSLIPTPWSIWPCLFCICARNLIYEKYHGNLL